MYNETATKNDLLQIGKFYTSKNIQYIVSRHEKDSYLLVRTY